MKNTIILFIAFLSLAVVSAQQKKLPKYFSNQEGIAIQGYDVVNYHTNNSAAKGSSEYSIKYDGATFYFVNKANKKAFKKNPEKFLPEYNGYCAFGVGKAQKKFPVDPTAFKIIDGKTHLFFVGEIRGKVTNTLHLWNMDEKNLKTKADEAWETLKNK